MAARITTTSADALREETAAKARITAISAEAHRDAGVFNPQLRLTAMSIDVLRPVRAFTGWPLCPGSAVLCAPLTRRRT